MRAHLSTVVLAALAVALPSAPALAASTTGDPVAASDSDEVRVCGSGRVPAQDPTAMLVRITEVVNRERVREHTDAAGNDVVTVTGRYVVRVDAPSSGKSLRIDASGPATVTTYPDGREVSVYGDRTIIWGAGPRSKAGLDAAGLPTLFLASGTVTRTVEPGPTGTFVFRSQARVRDLCAELR